MDRKELFVNSLNKFISTKGFVYKRNFFEKKTGKDIYRIEMTIWPNFSQVETTYTVINNEIERFKKKALGDLYDRSFTAGSNRYNVSGCNFSEATLNTDTEILALEAAQKEIDFYEDFVEVFFEKHNNIEQLDLILNNIPGTNLTAAYNPFDTCILAIIVARLSNRINLNELVSFYRSIAEKNNKQRISEFDSASNYILNSSISHV